MKTIKKQVTEAHEINNPGPAPRMIVQLDGENTANLLKIAQVLDIGPERLLNRWILRDELADYQDPQSGALRAIAGSVVYADEEQARQVETRIREFEQRHGAPDSGPIDDMQWTGNKAAALPENVDSSVYPNQPARISGGVGLSVEDWQRMAEIEQTEGFAIQDVIEYVLLAVLCGATRNDESMQPPVQALHSLFSILEDYTVNGIQATVGRLLVSLTQQKQEVE